MQSQVASAVLTAGHRDGVSDWPGHGRFSTLSLPSPPSYHLPPFSLVFLGQKHAAEGPYDEAMVELALRLAMVADHSPD
jgi:hypothetical protein